MGLLDKITEIASSIAGDKGSGSSLIDGVTDIFKSEGVNGVMEKFKEKGLGDILSSWIGTGSNTPISADQIKDVLGADRLKELADKAGISTDKASSMLKDMLPDIFDKISPDGKINHDKE